MSCILARRRQIIFPCQHLWSRDATCACGGLRWSFLARGPLPFLQVQRMSLVYSCLGDASYTHVRARGGDVRAVPLDMTTQAVSGDGGYIPPTLIRMLEEQQRCPCRCSTPPHNDVRSAPRASRHRRFGEHRLNKAVAHQCRQGSFAQVLRYGWRLVLW